MNSQYIHKVVWHSRFAFHFCQDIWHRPKSMILYEKTMVGERFWKKSIRNPFEISCFLTNQEQFCSQIKQNYKTQNTLDLLSKNSYFSAICTKCTNKRLTFWHGDLTFLWTYLTKMICRNCDITFIIRERKTKA